MTKIATLEPNAVHVLATSKEGLYDVVETDRLGVQIPIELSVDMETAVDVAVVTGDEKDLDVYWLGQVYLRGGAR